MSVTNLALPENCKKRILQWVAAEESEASAILIRSSEEDGFTSNLVFVTAPEEGRYSAYLLKVFSLPNHKPYIIQEYLRLNIEDVSLLHELVQHIQTSLKEE